MHNQRKTKVPKIWIIIAIILISSFIFCFLLFETDTIYMVDVSNFNNVTNILKRPISVEEVRREVEMIQSGTAVSEGYIDPVTDTYVPGSTESTGTEAKHKEVPTDNATTSQVASVAGVKIYDGPTQSGGGRFVDVTPVFGTYKQSLGSWFGYCYKDLSKPSSTIKNRVGGATNVDNVMCDSTHKYPMVQVGPGVMNSSRSKGSTADVSASEMYYGSIIDVVVKQGGKTYYIPCIVADCKVHTYPEYICQTGYAPKSGKIYYTAPGHKDNYTNPSANFEVNKAMVWDNSCVEFVASSASLSGLSNYEISGIIVY